MDGKLAGMTYPNDSRCLAMLTRPERHKLGQDLFIGTELSQSSKAFFFLPHIYIKKTDGVFAMHQACPRTAADTKLKKVQQPDHHYQK